MSWTFNPFTTNLDYYKDHYDIETHNTNTILTLGDLKRVHMMDVTGGVRRFTLPNIGGDDVGQWVILVRVGVGNALQIWAGGTDLILNSSPGGYIECVDGSHDYSSLELVVMSDGQWGTPSFGIWSTY